MARVASGDDQAFEEIFDRYGPALLSFCTHMLGSREWGEDALQLTFVAAYEALRRGGCDGALRPWLYAIARNRCLSELRARREIPDSDWVSADRPAVDGPASLFARREQLREVVDDIQRLPADQRAALVLFELGDQSHEEIASVLGVRRDKVKALIFQAREGLYRGRSARESACSEVRERLATARGRAPARGIVRAHIERCAPCQEFEREVRRQRAALALVLPVVLSGKLKALVLSSALSHGSVGAGVAGVTGAGGAGSLSGATVAGSGSGVVAGPGSLAAGAAASATGSASIAVGEGAVGGAGAAAGSGAVSAAVGSAAPTMVASALGTDAVTGMGVGALTSSVSVATVAKLATVVAVAVGVGGVTRSALDSSPRPQVSFLAGQPAQPAPLRSPLQPLVSGIVDPLAGATQPGSQPGAGAAAPAGAPPTGAASAPVSVLKRGAILLGEPRCGKRAEHSRRRRSRLPDGNDLRSGGLRPRRRLRHHDCALLRQLHDHFSLLAHRLGHEHVHHHDSLLTNHYLRGVFIRFLCESGNLGRAVRRLRERTRRLDGPGPAIRGRSRRWRHPLERKRPADHPAGVREQSRARLR